MRCIDLFAGLGGFSEGARQAGLQVLWGANHSAPAVYWHSINHPLATHACQDLQQCDFRQAPAHDVLLAAPACQGHTPARGAEKPHHDAQRATAWAVITCAEVHRPVAVPFTARRLPKPFSARFQPKSLSPANFSRLPIVLAHTQTDHLPTAGDAIATQVTGLQAAH